MVCRSLHIATSRASRERPSPSPTETSAAEAQSRPGGRTPSSVCQPPAGVIAHPSRTKHRLELKKLKCGKWTRSSDGQTKFTCSSVLERQSSTTRMTLWTNFSLIGCCRPKNVDCTQSLHAQVIVCDSCIHKTQLVRSLYTPVHYIPARLLHSPPNRSV